MARRKAFTLVLIAVLLSCITVSAEDWPQWRGPNRDGVWTEDGIVKEFSSAQLPVLWRAPIANGYSGPTVANGRVFITDRLTEPTQVERVHCFDSASGKEIWSHTYDCTYEKVSYPDGPRAAVTVAGGRAYSLGAMGHLFCFDAANGRVLWNIDLNTKYKINKPIWAIAAAPLVESNLLIVQVGGPREACIVAFDKDSGKQRWKALNDSISYSAPIIIEQAGKRVFVCLTGERIVGLDPLTGELYWEHPFEPLKMVISVPTPVFRNGYLFVSSFYDGSLMLKVDPDKLSVEKLWRRIGKSERETDGLHCMISTPVIIGDYLYGVDSYGELRCLEAQTGDRVWESLEAVPTARWANIHMVENGKNIWMFNERGELIISRLSPKGFREISRTKLIQPTTGQLDKRNDGVCWAHPAYANRNVYIRNDNELLCASLAAKD